VTRLDLPTTSAESPITPQLGVPATAPAAPKPSALAGVTATLPGGLGAGWWVLIFLGGLVGAGLFTRLPALLGSSARGTCPYGKPTTQPRRDPP
jgi:hypothetical protein